MRVPRIATWASTRPPWAATPAGTRRPGSTGPRCRGGRQEDERSRLWAFEARTDGFYGTTHINHHLVTSTPSYRDEVGEIVRVGVGLVGIGLALDSAVIGIVRPPRPDGKAHTRGQVLADAVFSFPINVAVCF